MLEQPTQNNLSRLMLTAGLCMTIGIASQIHRNITKAHETGSKIAMNGMIPNGTSFNGTSFNGTSLNGANLNGANLNGVSLNGAGLGMNGVAPNGTSFNGVFQNGFHFKGLQLTSPSVSTAVLKQKPIQQIRLEGSQLALKIKRSD
jgi:uncharacterized protein YjbI with pentapeptide repeats